MAVHWGGRGFGHDSRGIIGNRVVTPRISFDGDSISATANYGFVNRWMADTPGVATTNLSVAGACIAATENATNNLEGRVSNVVSFNPTLHVICIGTNDLASIDAPTFESRMTDYINQLRSAGYTGKLAACGIGPCGPSSTGGHANVNGRRGAANAWLRSQVGNLLDAYIPRGEHPIYDTDAAAQNTTWWNGDQIHPLQIPHRAYWQMLHDVLDPYIAQLSGTAANPTLSLPSLSNYSVSTAATMRGRVTGLALGQTATLAVSGGPSTSIGIGAFDTTTKTLMNGDVPQIQVTSSPSNSTAVTGTYTFNGTPTSWGVTTMPAAWPATTTTLDAANKNSTVTLSGTPPLTATAGAGGAFQMARATAPASNDWTYFEVLLGVAGDTAAGKGIAIHDAAVPTTTKIPGYTSPYQNDGMMFYMPGSGAVYNGGSSIQSIDFLSIPQGTAGSWMGFLLHRPTGRVWLQTASGVYWPGDPTVLDGGVQLAAPLAQYYCSLMPKTNGQGETINYGATPFTYTLPPGFAPHG